MTTMTIIEKCRERFQEIPELQKKYSQTEESARVNYWKLKNLEKEYSLLSKLLGIIEENEGLWRRIRLINLLVLFKSLL